MKIEEFEKLLDKYGDERVNAAFYPDLSNSHMNNYKRISRKLLYFFKKYKGEQE